jgi:hydrogenase-4 component B
LPTYVIPAIDRAVVPITHTSASVALVPPFFNVDLQRQESLPAKFVAEFHDLGAQVGGGVLPGRGLVVLHRGEEQNPVVFAMSTSYTLVVFAAILAVVFIAFQFLSRRRLSRRGPVWDGGLRHLWPGTTYTATGFSNPVRVIFEAILQPAAGEDSVEAVARHFRTAIKRNHIEAHIVDRLVLDPLIASMRGAAAVVRKMHVGHVNAYAAYVLLTMLFVLIVGAVLF